MGLRYRFGFDTKTVAGTDPGYAFFASNSPTIERQEPEVLNAVVRANQNNAGIYGTVTRIGRLAVGQTIVLHR